MTTVVNPFFEAQSRDLPIFLPRKSSSTLLPISLNSLTMPRTEVGSTLKGSISVLGGGVSPGTTSILPILSAWASSANKTLSNPNPKPQEGSRSSNPNKCRSL